MAWRDWWIISGEIEMFNQLFCPICKQAMTITRIFEIGDGKSNMYIARCNDHGIVSITI